MKPYNRSGSSKGEEVRDMFNSIAPSYDRLNHILSFQIDKLWRRRVVKIVERHVTSVAATVCTSSCALLDVATGTGDLAIALGEAIPSATVLGVDPSEGMLSVAASKIAARPCVASRLSTMCCSAESLPLASESFDCVTAAFGVRNFSDLEGGLEEMVRVTKRGGLVVVLEFSTPSNRLFRGFYHLYSRYVLPRVGALLSRDRAAYDYLPASVAEFSSGEDMLTLLGRAGLTNCYSRSQSFGIAHIYVGVKR